MEMLTVKDVKKSFDGVEILKGISLTAQVHHSAGDRRCRGNFYLRRKPGKKLPYGNRGLFR